MQTDNPFVGPRPLTSENRIFGRDHEIADLFHLVMAERIVLLHSPSGAGKSSLINAGLIPELVGRFDLWSATRVNLEPPPGITPLNRYAWSAMMGLEEGVPKSERRSPETLASMTLKDYALSRPCPADVSPNKFLIIDQFEEIIRTASEDVPAQTAFFLQLSELLALPNLWVLFSVREDYLAPLLPLAAMLPTHLRARYRLDFLNTNQAKLVMTETAALGGRTVHPDVVNALIENLAAARFQTKSSAVVVQSLEANYIEPMHLQVVCRRLWEELPPSDRSVDPEDVAVFGDVSRFLGEYYDSVVLDIAGDDTLRQRAIREWFHDKLIRDDIRSQIQMGPASTEGLPNRDITKLLHAHLVRTEKRRGVTWVELAHDRLIEPVQLANDQWFLSNINDAQRAAALWVRQDRNKGLLLSGAALEQAKAWRNANPDLATQAEKDFIEISIENQNAIKREADQTEKLRRRFWMAMATTAMAIVCVVVAVMAWADADLQRENALAAKAKAESARRDAVNARNVADAAKKRADDEAESARDQELIAQEQKKDADVAKEIAIQEAKRANSALAGTSAREAEMNIAVGRENLALAYLANALRSDPEKQEYRVRLADLFMRSYWWLPTRPFAESEKPATVLLSSLHDDNSYLTILRSNGSLEEWGTSESTPSTSKILNGFATGKWDFARFNEKVELLFTASESKRFQVWSCVSGQPVSSIESVPWSIRDATFSADSSRILLIGSDAVGIWDVSMRKLIWSAISAGVAGLQGAGTRPAGIHPDGQRFFFRESGTTVEIRSLQDGASVGAPVELPGGAGAVSFTADGKNLSVIVAGKSIRVQNLANRERVIDYSPDGGVREIVHGPGTADTWLAVLPGDSSKHKVILKNLGSGDEVQLLSAGSPTSIRFSRDGSLVAVASDDRVVQVWKVRTGERITRELVHDDLVSAIQFNDTKPTLSTTTNRGAVQIWDLDSSQRVGVPFGGDHRLELARFQESAVTALTIGADNSVTAWKVGLHDDSEILRELQLKPPSPVAFSGATLTGDGAWILTASAKEGRVVLWDARTASPKVKPIDVGRSPTRIIKNAAVSRSGERVAVNYQNGSVSLWDVSSQKELRELLKSGDRQLTTGFSPDGQTVLVAFTDGKLRIAKWRDADTKPSILSLKGTSKAIEISEDPRISAKVSFSEDRRRLSVAANNVVQIWDVDSGEPVGPDIESNYEPPTLPAVSPDRRTVVAGVDSKQLRVSTWRRSTTSPWTHGDLPRFTSPISAVSWNGTSTRFATLTESGEVRVWARDTLQPVGPQMILRGGTPVSIAFSFDSKRLLTVAKVSKESRLQLWDIQAGILIGRPLVYPGAVKRVEASSDGRFFMIFGDDGYVRLVSNFVDSGSPVEAGLLANFAEAVSGYRIEKNLLQRIPDQWAELKRIRQSVAAMPDEPGSLAWYILRFFKRYEVQPLRTAATTR